MADVDGSSHAPRPDELGAVFQLAETRTEDDRVFYYGESLVPERALMRELWPAFRQAGYDLRLAQSRGPADVLVAEPTEPGVDGVPWKNLLLLGLTLLSTLFVGATAWYHVPISTITEDPLAALQAWPFTAAVLGVLLTHELGHYALGRYHGVDVSLPYVIPFVHPFGTMGAIIRMRGQMPDREALFDVGVAGPLAGLAATLVVTVVGLVLSPVAVPEGMAAAAAPGGVIVFNNPPLLEIVAVLLGEPVSYGAVAADGLGTLNPVGSAVLELIGRPSVVADPGLTVHPVIIGAWVGMFFTVLNLLPVGQLDGGHMLRAMIGERQETVAALVPMALFGLAAFLYYRLGLGLDESVGLWAFWGLFATFIAFNGPADPIDETPLGWKRQAIGAATFGLGLLCLMIVPIRIVGA